MNTKSLSPLLAVAAIATGTYFLGSQNQQTSNADSESSRNRSISIVGDRHLHEILNDPNPITYQKGYLDFLENLTAGEAREAAEMIWATPGELAEIKERQKLFAYAWGTLDGEATVDFVMSNKSVAKVPALAQAFAGWASKDPQAARTWIEGRMKPSERLLYNWALVDGWSRHDPNGATDYVLSLNGLPGSDRFIRSIALEQVRRDPANATQWISSLPEGSMKNTAIEEIAQRWSQVDPSATVDWAASVSNAGAMKRAVEVTLTQWSQMDSEEAGAYLEQMSPSPARDQALAAHINVLASDNLQGTAAWAGQIQDTALREESLLRIANEWSDRDGKAVLAWLPDSGLSKEEAQKITTQLGMR